MSYKRHFLMVLACVLVVLAQKVSVSGSAEPLGKIITIPLPTLPTDARPLRMVLIRAGEFKMGSPETEPYRDKREGPVHQVEIGYDFYMGETVVTQAQWEAVMGTTPSYFKDCGYDCPVEQISWNDCHALVVVLNELALGYTFRLPTEAEWEFACRAGTVTRVSFGDALEGCFGCGVCELCDEYMWWCGNSGGQTHPVAEKRPNPWGLYDMHGNIFEWCEDDWHDNYHATVEPTHDPVLSFPRKRESRDLTT